MTAEAIGSRKSMLEQTANHTSPSVPAPATGTPFSGLLGELAGQTSQMDHQAQQAVTGLLSGQGVDVHQAMIASQRADMTFELALQVRNKAVGAYQQMMQMQF